MNDISGKQLCIMIFFIPLVFKMSSLPALLYGEAGATAYILIAIVTTVEFLQLGLVLFVAKRGGMEGIKRLYGKKTYVLVALPMFFIVFCKMIALTQEIVSYVSGFLFYNIPDNCVLPIVLLAVFYLGTRGARAIGRLYELSVWFIPIIIVLGVFFGKADVEFFYLTPVFDRGASEYFGAIRKFLIYTFDFSPLLFMNVKIKRAAPVAVCSVLSVGAVTAAFALLYAAYGNASFLANAGFARLASFNTVISEIGSLDWPSVLLWLTTGTLSLSLKIAAIDRISDGIGMKKVGTAVFCLGVWLVLSFSVNTLSQAVEFVTNGVQYGVFFAEILLPIVILFLLALKSRRENRSKIELNAQ